MPPNRINLITMERVRIVCMSNGMSAVWTRDDKCVRGFSYFGLDIRLPLENLQEDFWNGLTSPSSYTDDVEIYYI